MPSIVGALNCTGMAEISVSGAHHIGGAVGVGAAVAAGGEVGTGAGPAPVPTSLRRQDSTPSNSWSAVCSAHIHISIKDKLKEC